MKRRARIHGQAKSRLCRAMRGCPVVRPRRSAASPWLMRVFQYQRPRPYHPPPPSSRIRRIIMRSVVVSMCDSCGDARDTAALREMRVHGTNAPKHSSVPLDRPPGRLRLPAGQSTRCGAVTNCSRTGAPEAATIATTVARRAPRSVARSTSRSSRIARDRGSQKRAKNFGARKTCPRNGGPGGSDDFQWDQWISLANRQRCSHRVS